MKAGLADDCDDDCDDGAVGAEVDGVTENSSLRLGYAASWRLKRNSSPHTISKAFH